MSTEIVPAPAEGALERYKMATDVAGVCKEFVVKTAVGIQGKRFVRVEGWQSIAAAHGCIPEIESVSEIELEGVRGIQAIAVLRRMSDQAILSRAYGFLGSDEKSWGGRNKFARLAMAQTRAMSRVCRHAFAYVVVMMGEGLETTPAEEMGAEPHPAKVADVTIRVEGPISKIVDEVDRMGPIIKLKVGERVLFSRDPEIIEDLKSATGAFLEAQVIPRLKSHQIVNFQFREPEEPEPELELPD